MLSWRSTEDCKTSGLEKELASLVPTRISLKGLVNSNDHMVEHILTMDTTEKVQTGVGF